MKTEYKILIILILIVSGYFLYRKNGEQSISVAANDNSDNQIAPYFMTYNQPAQTVPSTAILQSNAVAALNQNNIPSSNQVPSTISNSNTSSNWCGCGS